ncbi:uncharacterized protein ColSpa_07667 [Colletotrichum spaethianum]|uniref:Uncharacterized protein n=1 Tax=Colletotrichum spaethianum TaxID=700344 RepID=A0AA37P8A6_9PEZI|nr:uncharacterized protein ColSpa_07667 [Colletotrichum spaethianum]GKT47486.1 hypothetical protein ColSpa_07667 [Colletotrichum spaethianum]
MKSTRIRVPFRLLLFGEMEVEEANHSSEDAGFIGSRVDVGLVLRTTQRDYAPGAFERVGVFAIPKDFDYFGKAEVQRLVLV